MRPEIADYIEQFEPEQSKVLFAVRNLILESHPAVEERFLYKTPFYLFKSYLCYFSYHKSRRRFVLGFVKGYLMDDPYDLLKADDKQQYIRHLVINYADFPDPDIISFYLQMAIEINEKRADRRLF